MSLGCMVDDRIRDGRPALQGEQNEVRQKYQNFIRRDPYKLGQAPFDQQNNSKVKHYFGGF